MSQIDEKTAVDHMEDFFEGMFDTAIKAPISFGDFLGRISGYRDYQLTKDSVLNLESDLVQKQAINEIKIMYEVLNNETARSHVIDFIVHDIQERPAYYLGGSGTVTAIGKTFSTDSIRRAYKGIIIGSKVEQKVHELYGMSERAA